MVTKLLWRPSEDRIKNSNMMRFMEFINKRYGKKFGSYEELYQWSIENIPEFWASMWEFGGIKASKGHDVVCDDLGKMPGANWFIGARLNFAENLLRYRDDHLSLIFRGETGESRRITYAQLYKEVGRLASSLREIGVTKGDRVAGFMPNLPETVICMLAATSIGAVWSSSSPDFGIKGVLDRFGQIEPKLLFTADGYSYNGKFFDSLGRVSEILKGLPSVKKVVVVPYVQKRIRLSQIPNAILYEEFISPEKDIEIRFEQLPFDHPLYIMYSSGTTGLPKCMVQGAGGVLIQHLKELKLHTDVKREDTIFYFTTCGWMMWNWLLSSLALGATALLFDGSPFYPVPEALWKLVENEKITIFGTSARYLAAIEKEGVKPKRKYDLKSLKTILSTGSPLSSESFEYVYREIREDILLSSISGGTDLNGCFAAGNPIGPKGSCNAEVLEWRWRPFQKKENPLSIKKGNLSARPHFHPCLYIFGRMREGKNTKVLILMSIQIYGAMEIMLRLPIGGV